MEKREKRRERLRDGVTNEKSLATNVTTFSTRDTIPRSRRRATGDARTDMCQSAKSAPARAAPPPAKSTHRSITDDKTSRDTRNSEIVVNRIVSHFFSSFFLSEGRMRFGGSRMRRASTERTRTTLLWIAALMQ